MAIHYNSASTKDEAEATLAKLKKAGVKATAVQANMDSAAAVQK